MTTKLVTEIEDSDEEVTAPAWTAVTEAPKLKRELYPSEKKRALISGHVTPDDKAALENWAIEHDTTLSQIVKILGEQFLVTPYMQQIVTAHLPERDELAEILKEYTSTQRAQLAAVLRGKEGL